MDSGTQRNEGSGGYRVELDEKNQMLTYGPEDALKKVRLDEHNIYVDGRLANKVSVFPFVYNTFAQAMENIKDGTETEPMNVYIAPYVYWLHDPASPSTQDPYGMILKCGYLHLQGLTDDAREVVIAANYGHDEGLAGSNWTMFHVTGDGLHISNLTIGNYCNVDLEYPPDESLNVAKRTTNITQAQIGIYDGDRLLCENVRFISRLNMMPFIMGGAAAGRVRRALYVNCHMECTDDALNGAAHAVYLGCDFDFYASKPWYTADGVTLLDCTMRIRRQYPGEAVEQYLAKNLDHGGKFTLVDCRFICDFAGSDRVTLGYSEALPDSYRGYISGVTLNGRPTVLDGGGKYPRACVDITGTDVLKAFKLTDADGNIYYNVYNLLKGDDGWDPLGQQERVAALGGEAIEPEICVTATAEVIESGVSGAEISVADPGAGTVLENSAMDPGVGAGMGNSAIVFETRAVMQSSVRYSLPKEDAEYVSLRNHGDGTCTVEGRGKENAKTVTVDIVLPDGRTSAVTFRVIPRRLKPPVLSRAPYIEQSLDGTASVYCSLKLDGRTDQSRITWYLSRTGSFDDAVPISCGRGAVPLHSISLNRGFIGYYLIAVIEPRQERSDYGEAVTVISENRIVPEGIDRMSDLDVDIAHFSTKRQDEILPGVWTVDSYRPEDMVSTKSWALEGEDVYAYGTGAAGGAAGYTGLYQLRCGTRLMYTPEESAYGDMEAVLRLVPSKTASQGFGSYGQYMDILIKLDTASMTGFGLRIFRKTSHSCAFGLVALRDGKAVFLTDLQEAACFVGEVTARVKFSGGVLSAHCGTSKTLPDPSMTSGVSCEAKVESDASGGFALVHTGTPGESAVYITSVEIKWAE